MSDEFKERTTRKSSSAAEEDFCFFYERSVAVVAPRFVSDEWSRPDVTDAATIVPEFSIHRVARGLPVYTLSTNRPKYRMAGDDRFAVNASRKNFPPSFSLVFFVSPVTRGDPFPFPFPFPVPLCVH
jgi:hypothetical protein